MVSTTSKITSTLIISVYKDCSALRLILDSLSTQTTGDYEIIISEDGMSDEIRECIKNAEISAPSIIHLNQKDDGFRKNIALNRAITTSSSDHLIFIDGDCIPHPEFIAAHQYYAKQGVACSGRRVEVGKRISQKIRDKKISITRLTNRFSYFLYMVPLLLDKSKNIESGIYSKLLQMITLNNKARLLGCNFSCNKQDLITINGFNEDYLAAGTGEDSDIDWRLVKSGVEIKKIKFSAIQYHLHHPRSYGISDRNIALLRETKRSDSYYCKHGLKQ